MRQGIGCLLWEAGPESLAQVRRDMQAWHFTCRTIGAELVAEATAGEVILVVEIRGEQSAATAVAIGAHRAAGGVTLALCRSDDTQAVARAIALGCDDLVLIPYDPVALARRLQTLSSLAALASERQRRGELFAPYGSELHPATPRVAGAGRPASVALLGRPGTDRGQVVAALPAAHVTYLDNPGSLPAILRRDDGVDLLVVTEWELLGPALRAIDLTATEPPFLVAAHNGAPCALELPQQFDLLGLPAPTSVLRLRLALALRIANLRRWLRKPPLGAARELLIDTLTGTYNHEAFLDYLRCTGPDRVLIGLEHGHLDQVNQQRGYAAGNRILAQLGWSLRRRIRAHDLAGHLGGGRFVVAVPAESRDKLERVRYRLQSTVAEDEPWLMLAAAETLPVRGTPAQRLARLFGDLGRLRAAA